jgi:energy-coupling factor transport system ATP-binding protein
MEIVVRGVDVIYMPNTPWERKVLHDVTLRIPSGSFAAVLGATGSGKSTLVQVLAGLIRPTRGQVEVGDAKVDARSKSLAPLRRRVGIVFQYPEHQLFEETVEKDIAFGPCNLGLPGEEVAARVKRAMEWVGLPAYLAGRSPFHLSGGQMRRAAIAGVLAMEPDVLILDEPTVGLDSASRRDLLDMIAALYQERRQTVVLVTHDMEEAARHADQVIVMVGGKVAASGSPVEIFDRVDILHEWKLDLPEAAKLAAKLNERLNPPLPRGLFTLEALEEQLVRLLERGRAT